MESAIVKGLPEGSLVNTCHPVAFTIVLSFWPAETHLEVFKISPQSSHLSPVSSPKAVASSVLSKFRESQQNWDLHVAQESDTPVVTELRVRVYLHGNASSPSGGWKRTMEAGRNLIICISLPPLLLQSCLGWVYDMCDVSPYNLPSAGRVPLALDTLVSAGSFWSARSAVPAQNMWSHGQLLLPGVWAMGFLVSSLNSPITPSWLAEFFQLLLNSAARIYSGVW